VYDGIDKLELVVRDGAVVTETGVERCDVGISGGQIVRLGDALCGLREIDASNLIVLPGGIDSHCHIEQESSLGGVMTADDFASATRSAAYGGNTTVIPFACQCHGDSMVEVVETYGALAEVKAHIDYTFHLMVTDPTEQVVSQELPQLITTGYRSIKLYMAYERMRVNDLQMLTVMEVAREAGALVIVHAENWDMIQWATAKLCAEGQTDPRFHPKSHPAAAEVDAVGRVVVMSDLVDAPVLVLHVSTPGAVERLRQAKARGTKVYAETCPQYLYLTAADMDVPGPEAAKLCCSPPLRDAATQEALWEAIGEGLFDLVSSDHCPYRFDRTGKLVNAAEPTFKQVPNGLPGLEARLPLLFSGGVAEGRISIEDFASLSATNAARLYGIYPRKGVIAEGSDADLALWDPDRRVRLGAAMLHDNAGYTPYEGIEVTGWPVSVISRGRVIVEQGRFSAERGSGQLLLAPDRAAAEVA
jgi:dihydropyrimidinase